MAPSKEGTHVVTVPQNAGISASRTKGAMLIVCEWHLATAFGAGTAEALRSITEECARDEGSVASVFLFVAGRALVGASPPPSSWAARPGAVEEGAAGATADDGPSKVALLDACSEALGRLPQPLVGLADGRLCGIGTALLRNCDLLIATDATEFRLPWSAGGAPAADLSTVPAGRARDAGLVSRTVGTEAELFSECDRLRQQLAGYAPAERRALKAVQPGSLQQFLLPAEHPETSGPPRRPKRGSLRGMEQEPPPSEQDQDGYTRGLQRKKEMVAQYFARDGPITSLMICNLPCRITQEQLVLLMDSRGFYGKFDFVYLPTATRSAAASPSNLGYGFVNFIHATDALRFRREFENFSFEGTGSNKVIKIRPALIQGLEENMHNFSHSVKKHKNQTPFVRIMGGSAQPPRFEDRQGAAHGAGAMLQACPPAQVRTRMQ